MAGQKVLPVSQSDVNHAGNVIRHSGGCFLDRINHPPEWSRRGGWITFDKYLGRAGFFAKGFVYSLIGGLCMHQAVEGNKSTNASPQGAFVLVGSSSIVVLALLGIGIILYSMWRLFEGITGQGYDDNLSAKSNFFKFRVSPLISGIVYLVYFSYIVQLLASNNQQQSSGGGGSCNGIECWSESTGGRIGLVIIAIAFLAATVTQAIPAFKGTFKRDLDKRRLNRWYPPYVKYAVYTLGHIGFVGRGFLFLFVSILFFRVAAQSASSSQVSGQSKPQLASALDQLATETWLRVILFIVGFGVLLYGIFAALNSYFKIFPTPPPSRVSAAE